MKSPFKITHSQHYSIEYFLWKISSRPQERILSTSNRHRFARISGNLLSLGNRSTPREIDPVDMERVNKMEIYEWVN